MPVAVTKISKKKLDVQGWTNRPHRVGRSSRVDASQAPKTEERETVDRRADAPSKEELHGTREHATKPKHISQELDNFVLQQARDGSVHFHTEQGRQSHYCQHVV